MATTPAAKKEKAPAKAKAAAPKAAAAGTATPAPVTTLHRKTIVGTVVSNKMQKTIVVEVDRQVRHEMYGKYLSKSARYKAHDEKNDAKVGDRVILVESRPLSKEKRWALQSITRRAGQIIEANV